ncbi:hypothetical protein AB0H00_28470 [Nocardia sp. NPDC023852]|uniref:hypothetical protein n=1 Tax=Nocardia sp. NPDC023852 TaxID=3154697 RepID=UPI0033D56800
MDGRALFLELDAVCAPFADKGATHHEDLAGDHPDRLAGGQLRFGGQFGVVFFDHAQDGDAGVAGCCRGLWTFSSVVRAEALSAAVWLSEGGSGRKQHVI